MISWRVVGIIALLLVAHFMAVNYTNHFPATINKYYGVIDEMRKEKLSLESTIHHSEQERSELESQKLEFEGERGLLVSERSALQEERERLEKARDYQNVPQGAFWEVVWPKWDCRAYGQREYWGILRNIPAGRSEMDACMNMPVEIRGVTVRRPSRCQYVDGSMHGFWMVDWDQPDCKPWHQEFYDWVRPWWLHPHIPLNSQTFQGLHEPGIRCPSHHSHDREHQR
jgi:hypothetical protein